MLQTLGASPALAYVRHAPGADLPHEVLEEHQRTRPTAFSGGFANGGVVCPSGYVCSQETCQPIDACAEDFERALTRRGCIESQEMAARIVYRDLIPDLILVSPAERAWATAEIIAVAI